MSDIKKDNPIEEAQISQQEEQQVASSSPRNNNDAPERENIIRVEPLKASEMQPSYAQELPIDDSQYGWYAGLIHNLGGCCGTIGSIPGCFCFPNPYERVYTGSVGLITRFGKFYKSVDPGLTKINPFSERLYNVDVKIQIVNIPQQSAITKDNVNVMIDSVIYYHITNPYLAAFGISDVKSALVERAQTTLRQVIGARNLQNVVTEREAIALEIEEILEHVSSHWGVQVESILIKDVNFSKELQESLSSAAQAKRVGESKVIAARAEVDAAKLMREAADILSSPAAIQIRQLEALQSMARQSNSKTIFVPMTLTNSDLSSLQTSGNKGKGTANASNDTDLGQGMSLSNVAHLTSLSEQK